MSNNKIIKMLIITILLITIMLVIPPMKVSAFDSKQMQLASTQSLINPDDFDPQKSDASDPTQYETITNKAATIISAIRIIGVIVAVIALMLIGIKYMTSSLEERAEYKKSMIPYLIGVFIFFALSQILAIIIDVSKMFE